MGERFFSFSPAFFAWAPGRGVKKWDLSHLGMIPAESAACFDLIVTFKCLI